MYQIRAFEAALPQHDPLNPAFGATTTEKMQHAKSLFQSVSFKVDQQFTSAWAAAFRAAISGAIESAASFASFLQEHLDDEYIPNVPTPKQVERRYEMSLYSLAFVSSKVRF